MNWRMWVRQSFVDELVDVAGEGLTDRGGEFARFFVGLFLLLEQFKCPRRGFCLGDDGIVQVTRNDDFLPDVVLGAITTTVDFTGSVGDSL